MNKEINNQFYLKGSKYFSLLNIFFVYDTNFINGSETSFSNSEISKFEISHT
jgi:hypothetical protein